MSEPAQVIESGGQGAPLPTSDGHHTRADLVVVRQAVTQGWNVPAEWRERLPRILLDIAINSKKPRERRMAIEGLRKMMDSNLAAAELLAKLEGDMPSGDVNMAALVAFVNQRQASQPEAGHAAITRRLDSLFEPTSEKDSNASGA